MAELIFNPKTGIEVPEVADIREDIGQEFQEAFKPKADEPSLNIEPTSPMGQLIDAITAEIMAKNSEVAYLAGQCNLNASEARYLDALVSLFFITRKLSEPTIVQCVCTGLKGTVIPYGAIVEDINGNQFRHNVVAGVTIPDSGTITTTFAAIEHGALDVAEDSVTKIVTVVPGWDTVNNDVAGVTGRAEESDVELRSRYRNSVSINSVGNVETIEANISEIDGVIDCQVLENITNTDNEQFGVTVPNHGIAVCVFGGEDEKIAEAIYRTKMGGTAMKGNSTITYVDEEHFSAKYEYPIYRPTVQPFYVKVEFYTDTMNEDTQQSVKEAIVNDALGQYLSPRIGLAQTVYADRFRSAIFSVVDTPVKSVQIGLNSSTSLSDKITIDADIEPSAAVEYVTIECVGA